MAVLHTYDLAGTPLRILDAEGSDTARIVAMELANDEYQLRQIPFEAGDVIVDVGAHVGMVAIWLALRYPQITVIAVEPEPLNLSHLRTNIAAHGVNNIVVVPQAVTADRRRLSIARPPSNSGGAGCYYDQTAGYATSQVNSTTLDAIFDEFVPGDAGCSRSTAKGRNTRSSPPAKPCSASTGSPASFTSIHTWLRRVTATRR